MYRLEMPVFSAVKFIESRKKAKVALLDIACNPCYNRLCE